MGWSNICRAKQTTIDSKALRRPSVESSQRLRDNKMMPQSGTSHRIGGWAPSKEGKVQDTHSELNGLVDNPPSKAAIFQRIKSPTASSSTEVRSGGVRRIRRLSDTSAEATTNGRIDEIRGTDGTFGNVLVVSDSTTKFRESLNHSRQVRRASKEKLMSVKHLGYSSSSSRNLVSPRGARNDGVTLRRIGSAPSLTLRALTKTEQNERQRLSSTMDTSVPSPPISPRIIIGTKRRMSSSRRASLMSRTASSQSAEEAFHNSFSSLDCARRNITKSADPQQNKGTKVGAWDPNFSLDNVRDFNSGQGGFSHGITLSSGLIRDPAENEKYGSPVEDINFVNTEPRRRQNRRSSMSGRINYSPEGQQQSSIIESVGRRQRNNSGKGALYSEGSEWKHDCIKSPNDIHAGKKLDVDDITVSAFGIIGANGGFKESPLDYGFKLKDFAPDQTTPTELSSIVRAKRSGRRHSLHSTRTTTSMENNEQNSSYNSSSKKLGRTGRALRGRRGSSGSLSGELNSEHDDKNNSQFGEQRRSETRSKIRDDDGVVSSGEFSVSRVGLGPTKYNSESIKQFFRRKSGLWSLAGDDIGSIQSDVQSPEKSAPTRRARRRGSLGSNIASHVKAKVEGSPTITRRNRHRSSISSHGSANDLQTTAMQENVLKSPRRRRGSLGSYNSINDLKEIKLHENVMSSPARKRESLSSHEDFNDLHRLKMQQNVMKSPRRRRGSLKTSTKISASTQEVMDESSARDNSGGARDQQQKAKSGDSAIRSRQESPVQQSKNVNVSPTHRKPKSIDMLMDGAVSRSSSGKTTPPSSRARRRRSSSKNSEDYITTQKRRSQSPSKSSQQTRRRSSMGTLPYKHGKLVRGREGSHFGREDFNDASTRSMSSFDTDTGAEVKIDIQRTEMLLKAVAT